LHLLGSHPARKTSHESMEEQDGCNLVRARAYTSRSLPLATVVRNQPCRPQAVLIGKHRHACANLEAIPEDLPIGLTAHVKKTYVPPSSWLRESARGCEYLSRPLLCRCCCFWIHRGLLSDPQVTGPRGARLAVDATHTSRCQPLLGHPGLDPTYVGSDIRCSRTAMTMAF